jgi:o-succinylbenzoate synthase
VLGSGEHRGQLRVPHAPGTGVTVREDLVREWAAAAPVVLTR